MANEYGELITHQREYMQSYIVRDGGGRMLTVYEARANAQDGNPCLRTDYNYNADGLITGMKEEKAAWDSSWDF